MRRAVLALVALSGLSAFGVEASQQGVATAYDCRLQRVVYNPSDVVELSGTPGISTHIILDPDETFITFAFGDPEAWTFRHKENHYFIKPKIENGDTNLQIVTDKRSYNFFIRYVKDTDKKVCSQVFQIAFGYPEKDKARESAVEQKAKVKDDKAKLEAEFHKPPQNANLNYTMSATAADRAIAPLNVWDDGKFTRLKFAGNSELPNVYVRNADGSEGLVNTTMEGAGNRVMVVGLVGQQFVLRLGTSVVGIYNEAFNGGSNAAETGTASEEVVRKIKGATDGE